MAGLTLLSWRRLPALAGPVPVTVQVLVGLVLTEATAVLTFGLSEAVSAMRYSQLPPPVDTSFMDYIITTDEYGLTVRPRALRCGMIGPA